MNAPLTTKGPKGQLYIWPTYRFGPDGERRLFDHPGDVPEDFSRSPPAVPIAVAEPPKKAPARQRKRKVKPDEGS